MTASPRRYSAAFSPDVIAAIDRAAEEGLYRIRGFGTLRPLPSFDDLVLLGASISRYPLEGYRERCATDVTLGTRFAKKPIELKIPITIAGMSFGALGINAKRALGRGASAAGTSTTTGDGGMSAEERAESDILVYQVLPSRYGFDPAHLRACEAIEIVVGQGAKPGGGGMLLGQKITERAQCLPPSGLDRPRRFDDQDRGTARGHRLGKAGFCQDRLGAAALRRPARGQGRRRCRRARRHAGRHRRHARGLYRACRHPDFAGLAPGRGGA
jgi:hypothetical protein